MKKLMAIGMASVMMLAGITGCDKVTEKSTGSESKSEYLLDVKYSDYVTLCDYKGIETTKVVFDISDDELQGEIEYYMYDYVTYDPVTDRAAEVGDYANITYTATIDGEVNEEYSGEEEDVLIGEGYIYTELEDALIGMNAGDKKEVEVELTEEFADEDMVGKKAVLDVTVNNITVENMPEYNLDFVKENTEFDTMEEFEESLKEELSASKEEEYKYVSIEELFTYLCENSEFNGYPEELYAQCEELYDSSNEYYASMYGMELEEFLDVFGIDEETKKTDIEANVNQELVIGAIAQAEGIDCTEKEIDEYVESIYADYEYESAEAFLEDYSKEEIGYDLIYQKVSEFLYEHAHFVEKAEEDYLAEQEAEFAEDGEELDDEALEEEFEESDDEALEEEFEETDEESVDEDFDEEFEEEEMEIEEIEVE